MSLDFYSSLLVLFNQESDTGSLYLVSVWTPERSAPGAGTIVGICLHGPQSIRYPLVPRWVVYKLVVPNLREKTHPHSPYTQLGVMPCLSGPLVVRPLAVIPILALMLFLYCIHLWTINLYALSFGILITFSKQPCLPPLVNVHMIFSSNFMWTIFCILLLLKKVYNQNHNQDTGKLSYPEISLVPHSTWSLLPYTMQPGLKCSLWEERWSKMAE